MLGRDQQALGEGAAEIFSLSLAPDRDGQKTAVGCENTTTGIATARPVFLIAKPDQNPALPIGHDHRQRDAFSDARAVGITLLGQSVSGKGEDLAFGRRFGCSRYQRGGHKRGRQILFAGDDRQINRALAGFGGIGMKVRMQRDAGGFGQDGLSLRIAPMQAVGALSENAMGGGQDRAARDHHAAAKRAAIGNDHHEMGPQAGGLLPADNRLRHSRKTQCREQGHKQGPASAQIWTRLQA